MDAVELPLPANVTIDKLIASEVLDRSGEAEASSTSGADASVLHKGSGCGPCRVDNDYRHTSSEYNSLSRNNKAAEEYCMNENQPSCFELGDGGKRHHVEEANRLVPCSPKQVEKTLGRKSVKKQVGNPSKRLKTEEAESWAKSAGTDDLDGVSGKAAADPKRCTNPDKSLTVKQRRVCESKRSDKKNSRVSLKNKYDFLTSKSGLVCNATFSSGNNILGTHGFKSDLHDILKCLDDLAISDLLDGSYEVPKLSLDKGKKSSNLNGSILLSVRKACSILLSPFHIAADNGGNIKTSEGFQDLSFTTGCGSDCETKDKQLEDSLAKTKDSFQTNWFESTLLSPKEIMDHLAHPLSHDLGAFFTNQNTSSYSELFTSEAKNCGKSILPPFPWSFSNGNSKHIAELCKVNSTKHLCQGKWVKIGNSFIPNAVDGSFLSGLSKAYGCNVDSMNQHKIDIVLEDAKTFVSTLSTKPCAIGTHPTIQFPDMVKADTVSGITSSLYSKAIEPMCENADSSISYHLECDSKGQASQQSRASVIVSRCQGNDINVGPSKSNLSFKDKADVRECPPRSIHDCYKSSCSCRNATSGSDCISWRLSAYQKYGEVHSTEQVLAADILCEIACCPDPMQDAKSSTDRIRWPKPPSMKTMKARKLLPSIDKPHQSFTTVACSNSIKKAGLPFSKHHLGAVRSDRDSVRWSSVASGATSPLSKLDEGLNSRLPPFPSHADKVYQNQQRKPPPMLAVAFEGSSIRDWIRGRSRRL
ncbi:hypothetical protein AXF42_Ash005276 [Apostasia shenzhenica]|uniref:Uncharacterized protein n=1 Tax=Apostasia shenzhenica TaxID=1088818 RepID=A0A2I0B6I4_9ASPA|nr:hypothetical protein AXF42_Ash005276 [Apostasia shenzhenica]